MNWRRESDKEVAQLSEPTGYWYCDQCQSKVSYRAVVEKEGTYYHGRTGHIVHYVGSQIAEPCGLGDGTHYACDCQMRRMAKLERLVEDALGYVEYAAENHINDHWSRKGLSWLARYREMFPEVK